MIDKKQVILTILLVALPLNWLIINNSNGQTVFLPSTYASLQSAHQYFSAHRPIFLWDLHKVIFTIKPSRIFSCQRSTKSNPNSAPSRFTVCKELITSLFCLSTYKTMYSELKLGTKVTQAYLDSFAHLPALHETLLHIANDIQTPNPDIYTLLTDIKKAGYQQLILSNIGPDLLADFIKQHPEVFDNFNSKQNTINAIKRHNNNSDLGPWLFKPQPEAYQTALQQTKTPSHLHIFIDDQ